MFQTVSSRFRTSQLTLLLGGIVLFAAATAQLAYLAAVAAGLPLDANALGPAALAGPTAGYLVGFVPAAFLAGWLAETCEAQSDRAAAAEWRARAG